MTSPLPLPLIVRDLTADDLPLCDWAGSGLPDGLERARRGEADYLVVCPPSGRPIATGGIDYVETPGAGTLYQFHVHEIVRSCGIGALLVRAAEDRARDRGLERVELGVDEQAPRPQRLYERLGYTTYGLRPGGWDLLEPDGSTSRYDTMIILMNKTLAPTSGTDTGPV